MYYIYYYQRYNFFRHYIFRIEPNNLTPKENYFTFTHSADSTGATPAEQLAIFNLLGLNQIAPSINVDANTIPYNNSRILLTSLATANGTTINPHSCVLVDNAVPNIQSSGVNSYLEPWTYMLTQSTSLTVENYTSENQKIVYPNPFSNKINVSNSNGNEEFILTNSIGQIIYSGKNIQEQIFSYLQNGFYFLKITNSYKNEQIIKLLKS